MSSITIKDIARELNLSTSTVSRALRDSYEINEETKKRVQEYAQKVKYSPNPIALSLRESKSHSIGIIVPEIANNYFSEVINGIDSVAYKKGYQVVIFQTHESYEREKSSLSHVINRKVDGIIISLSGGTNNYDHLQEAMDENYPIVYFDRVPPFEACHKVVSDNYMGAYIATRHLIEAGKTRIAHITSVPLLSITKERLEGYKAALKDHGIEHDERLVRYVGFDPQEAYDTVEDIIRICSPDSYFICSDRLALNCYGALQKYRDRLPEHCRIVGYTNLKSADLLDPPLTTIKQPAIEMGMQAAELLISILESKKPIDFKTIKLGVELTVR